MKQDNMNIANAELILNIKYQDVKVKEFMQIGCDWGEGIFVFILIIPKKLLPFKIKADKIK
jgi:hypothetical protein